jgi:hypothetical protein
MDGGALMGWTKAVLGAIPPAMVGVGLALPEINGPHLWFGLPSLVVWVALWTAAVTPLLLLYERMGESSR